MSRRDARTNRSPRAHAALGRFGVRGITFLEIMVTLGVLSVVAALIVPPAVHFKANQEARDLVPSIVRLVQYAREQAISKHTTAVLSYDEGTTSLVVKQDTTVDSNAPTVSTASASQSAGSTPILSVNAGEAVHVPSAPTPDASNPLINKSLLIPSYLTLSEWQLAGQSVTEPDFQLRFYADGTCDGGGIGMAISKFQQAIVVDNYGRPTVSDGALPEPNSQKWEAGSFEPRQDATS